MTSCILTTKDFTILEVMLERCPDKQTPLACLLRRKIEGAQVVFREDAPETVATLNSRVSFSVDGGEPQTRIICQSRISAPTGHFQPITTMRGLALLGLMQGQKTSVPGTDDTPETVTLLHVLHQPELAQRRAMINAPANPKPILRLVSGGKPASAVHSDLSEDDDPGPTAA